MVSERTAAQPETTVITWLEAQDSHNLYLAAITIGQMRYGVDRLGASAKRRKLAGYLDDLLDSFEGRILPLDERVAQTWARVRLGAEKAGRTLPFSDAVLAATAEVHEFTLVTRSVRDFEGWGGPVLNPWAPQPSEPGA